MAGSKRGHRLPPLQYTQYSNLLPWELGGSRYLVIRTVPGMIFP